MQKALFLSALVLMGSMPADAAPLEEYRNRLFLPVEVNGRSVVALLDSGAEMTILDDDFAARSGLALSGGATAHGSGATTMKARFAKGLTVKAAGLTLKDRSAGVLDLQDISDRLVGRPVEVILGRDLFDAARLSIDIENGVIKKVDRNAGAAGEPLPLSSHRGLVTFPVEVEDSVAAEAVLDLGNGSEVMIGRAYAKRIGVAAPERIVGQSTGGGFGGKVNRDMVVLRKLEIAGRLFRDVPAAIDDSATAADINIGTSILRHFLLTTDFSQGTVWLLSRN